LRRATATIIIVLLIAGAGWWFYRSHSAAGAIRTGHVSLQWRGKYQGRLDLPGQVSWCPVTRVGVLQSVSSDTGAMIVFYERDSLIPATYPISAPAQAAAGVRPAGTAALRWLHTAKDTVLAAFRSESGTMQVHRAPGTISGTLSARMRSMSGIDTLVLHGEFRDLPIVTTAVGCS
jgi:hypothetical protein